MKYQSRTPQVILRLSPEGRVVVELPSPSGSRRTEEVTSIESIRIILAAQLGNTSTTIGLDGAPCIGQITHWEKHEATGTHDEECPWCIAEYMGVDQSQAAFNRARRELRLARSRGPYQYSYTMGDGSVRVRKLPTKSKPKHLPKPTATINVAASSLFDDEEE
jgi:hypothetical protein